MPTSKRALDAQAITAVIGLCLLWGLSQVSIKVANSGVSPIFQAAVRSIIVAFASYLVWFWLIQVYPVSNISAFTFFTPVFGILLGALLLQEPLTVKLLIGGGLVTGGMVLVNWPAR